MAVTAAVYEMAADMVEGSRGDGPPKKSEDGGSEVQVGADANSSSVQSAPREDLITTAVHFLQNPRVQKSPLSQKRAFLLKKGLTQVEVDAALSRVSGPNISPQGGAVANLGPATQLPSHGQPEQHAVIPWPPGHLAFGTPPTLWQRWRDFCSSAVVIGATCYGIYYFYKQFLEPALIGQKRIEEDRLDRVERHLLELNKSLSQLRSTLVSVETTLAKQSSSSDAEEKNDAEVQDVISLAEIKSEMASIKALLLSRKQFPATPQLTTNIPAWQMKQQKEDDKSSSSSEETVPKQIPEDSNEDVHSVSNGVTVNGNCTENN